MPCLPFIPFQALKIKLTGENLRRVISILLLISRSKLVPDFALTLHFIHLIIVSLYSKSIPQNMLWWALQAASAAMMTTLGVWSCQYRELRPINFGGAAQSTTGESSVAASTSEGGDEEQGYGRGRGRGRGRDGAGEYEMVRMKGEGEAA
jgi:hypothetical protein